MSRAMDLTGQVFDRLTVISRADDEILSNGSKTARWLCQCVCGKTTIRRGTALRAARKSGKSASCGCARRTGTDRMHPNVEDLTGRVFGKWTVISRGSSVADKKGYKWTRWVCQCECGTVKEIRAQSLKAGTTKSCGCYKANRLGRNLIGQRFGRWVVMGVGQGVIYSGRTFRSWACVCDCGITREVIEQSLLSGKSVSCGCFRKEQAAQAVSFEDVTGQVFGEWTVLEKRPSRKYPGGGYAQMWLCRCSCGTVKEESQSLLKGGYTRSCGCLTESILESDVKRYLDEHGLDHVRQKWFEGLVGLGGRVLPYDFYVRPSSGPSFLIECQGEQHYRAVEFFGGQARFEERREHDRRKREYASERGIELLEITYDCRRYEDVAQVLDSYLDQTKESVEEQ